MPDVMTPKQVARLLHVSGSTVRRWIIEGHLPSFRTPGGQYRIREVDVSRLIESGQTGTKDPVAA